MSFGILNILTAYTALNNKGLSYHYSNKSDQLAEWDSQNHDYEDIIEVSAGLESKFTDHENNLSYSQERINPNKEKFEGAGDSIFNDTKETIMSASGFRANIELIEKKKELLGYLLDLQGV